MKTLEVEWVRNGWKNLDEELLIWENYLHVLTTFSAFINSRISLKVSFPVLETFCHS